MLVRDVTKRISLQGIMEHPWVKNVEPNAVPLVPLISREHLTDDDHSYILQTMIKGQIAKKDQVIQ